MLILPRGTPELRPRGCPTVHYGGCLPFPAILTILPGKSSQRSCTWIHVSATTARITQSPPYLKKLPLCCFIFFLAFCASLTDYLRPSPSVPSSTRSENHHSTHHQETHSDSLCPIVTGIDILVSCFGLGFFETSSLHYVALACRLGCPGTHRSTCFCLPSVRVKVWVKGLCPAVLRTL